MTTDVQSVLARLIIMGNFDAVVDIQCSFLSGSDVQGCHVELVSNCSDVEDKYVNITRNGTVAHGRLILNQGHSCYHQVFAYDIEVDNVVGNVSIQGRVEISLSSKWNFVLFKPHFSQPKTLPYNIIRSTQSGIPMYQLQINV